MEGSEQATAQSSGPFWQQSKRRQGCSRASRSYSRVSRSLLQPALVCEVDSSKMREETSSLEYDDHHHENLYNLTLSSKIQTAGGIEQSGSRSKRTTLVLASSQQRKPADSLESISTIPSVKHNRKQPPISLVPTSMKKYDEQLPLRLVKAPDDSRNGGPYGDCKTIEDHNIGRLSAGSRREHCQTP